jgi:hypothetical protein
MRVWITLLALKSSPHKVNFVEFPQSLPERSNDFNVRLVFSPVKIKLQAPHFRSQWDKFSFSSFVHTLMVDFIHTAAL